MAFSVVKVAGACYLIYVGFSQWRAGDSHPFTATKRHPLARTTALPDRFLTNATNPKGIIFMVAVLPQFMTDTRPLWTQLLVMAATTVAVDVVVMHIRCRCQRPAPPHAQRPRHAHAKSRFGGLLMAGGCGPVLRQARRPARLRCLAQPCTACVQGG